MENIQERKACGIVFASVMNVKIKRLFYIYLCQPEKGHSLHTTHTMARLLHMWITLSTG